MKSDDDCVTAYMPLFYGDYRADTGDLDCTEHGAYMQLLAELWQAGGYLPFNSERLARRINLQVSQWDAVWSTLARFFDVFDAQDGHGPRLSQKRLLSELEKAREMRQRKINGARKAGLASAASRATVVAQPFNGRSTDVQRTLVENGNEKATSVNHPPSPSPLSSSSNSESSLSLQIQSNPDQTRAHVERLPQPVELALMTFPCDGPLESFDVTASLLAEHQCAFPSLDVMAEYRQALAWVHANPSGRKTAKGMARFLVNWLSRAQNNGRGRHVSAPARNFTEEANNTTRQAYLAMVTKLAPT